DNGRERWINRGGRRRGGLYGPHQRQAALRPDEGLFDAHPISGARLPALRGVALIALDEDGMVPERPEADVARAGIAQTVESDLLRFLVRLPVGPQRLALLVSTPFRALPSLFAASCISR